MDKDSEERMAPALHTADHEAAGTIIANLKYSTSSPPHAIQSETDVFQQYNGVLSGHDKSAGGKSNQYFDTLMYESPSKTLQIGSSGDFGRMVPYLHDTTASKINSMRPHPGSGDASKNSNKEKISYSSEEESTRNFKESISIGKTAMSDTITNSVDTVRFTFATTPTLIDSSGSQKSLISTEKNSSTLSLSSKKDNTETTSTLDNFETKWTSNAALLVNVDKHDSINPQIIHTTSITTSALAVSNLHNSDHEKEGDHGNVNGRSKLDHKNDYLKQLFVTSTNSTSFINERSKQTTAITTSVIKTYSSPINLATETSTNNGIKSLVRDTIIPDNIVQDQVLTSTENVRSDADLTLTRFSTRLSLIHI